MVSRTKNMPERERESTLAQLKFPLVFFGLSLLVTESTLGAVVLLAGLSEGLRIQFGYMMVGAFVFTVSLVGLLTFYVPRNLMLLPQIENETKRIMEATHELSRFVVRPEFNIDSKQALTLIQTMDRLLKSEDEG